VSTSPIRCPKCGAWIRVSVQVSQIVVSKDQLKVFFDTQTVAHTCKE
jgi:predicted nucleic-acid-binding Zn-ribbon protein